tara:strand:+ start:3310 stop:3543 length:234 start_codon:yes stop_codon:yes gene_type:complete
MSKEWNCTISLTLTGNGIDAENKSDYINKLKHGFSEEHNIELSDDEISNVHIWDPHAKPLKELKSILNSIGYRGGEQ